MHVCSPTSVVFFLVFMVLQQGFGPQCLCLIFLDMPLMSETFMSCRVQCRTNLSLTYCQLLEVSLHLVLRLRGTSGGNRPIRFFLPRRLNMEGKPALVGQFGVNRFFRRRRLCQVNFVIEKKDSSLNVRNVLGKLTILLCRMSNYERRTCTKATAFDVKMKQRSW